MPAIAAHSNDAWLTAGHGFTVAVWHPSLRVFFGKFLLGKGLENRVRCKFLC
jgi:hypothetical protein